MVRFSKKLYLKKEQLLSNEFNALREELRINRKFIFERPLLIVGGAYAANALFKSTSPNSEFLGLIVVFILFYNLWFTINRLKSSARIIGFIKIFHESEYKYSWIGWESSLIKYRNYCKNNKEKINSIRKKYLNMEQYDTRRFYSPILTMSPLKGAIKSLKRTERFAKLALRTHFPVRSKTTK